jgi:hypothetical protein
MFLKRRAGDPMAATTISTLPSLSKSAKAAPRWKGEIVGHDKIEVAVIIGIEPSGGN